MADKDATERLKGLAEVAADLRVDSNIPIRRYFRSGQEMIKMAEVYFAEDSLEAAYVLYMKYMTLFVEKLKKHRDWGQVIPAEKKSVMSKIKTVMNKTEDLKLILRQRFTEEHNVWCVEEKIRRERELEMERERLAAQQRDRQAELESIERDRQVALWHHAQMNELEIGGQTGGQEERGAYDPSKYVETAPSAPPPTSYPPESQLSGPPPSYDMSQISSNLPGSQISPTPPASQISLPPPSYDRAVKPSADTGSPVSVPSFDRSVKPQTSQSGLRKVVVPSDLMDNFLRIASSNSGKGIETLGTLGGQLSHNRLVISHLLIPRQSGQSDSCTMEGLEEVWETHDKENIIFLGWIHTHPAFSVYLSSVDMHNQYEWQHMLPEALAIVCSIKDDEVGFLTLTSAGMAEIGSCSQTNFHPHSKNPPLFERADHVEVDPGTRVIVKDLR